MKKLFDVVVWETTWIYAASSDVEIPYRTKAYWGNDGHLVASFNSIRTATRVCRELRESAKMEKPKPVQLGNGEIYTPKVHGPTRIHDIGFGVVINDREFIF